MEIFVDFGLFELLAITGLAALGRLVFLRPVTRRVWLALSLVAPLTLIILSSTEATRWTAALALGTSAVNVSVLLKVTPEDLPKKPIPVPEPRPADAADEGVA